MVKAANRWDFRWKNFSVAVRRICSLLLDGLLFLYFMGQIDELVESESNVGLLLLNLFVLINFVLSPFSIGKVVFGLKVRSKNGLFIIAFRNFLVWLVFLSACLSVLEIFFMENLFAILFIILVVDKACIIGFHRETLVDRYLTHTIVAPREGSDEISREFFLKS